MTFHSIVEQWCRQYKYMRHNPKKGNKRFYLSEKPMNPADMAQYVCNKESPFVMMFGGIEGDGPIKRPKRNYPVCFFVRAEKQASGEEAAVAMETAWAHAQNFLTWLLDKHEKEVAENIDGDFARLALDDAYLMIDSAGPYENGWYAVQVQIEREEPLNLCVNDDLYDECEC